MRWAPENDALNEAVPCTAFGGIVFNYVGSLLMVAASGKYDLPREVRGVAAGLPYFYVVWNRRYQDFSREVTARF